MNFRVSPKVKLLTALTVILLGAFLITSLVNYHVTRESVRQELLNSALPLTGKNIYSEIHSQMMRPILVASSMASDTFLWDWVDSGEQNVATIKKYLNEIREKYNFMVTFFVSHTSDTYYYNNGILKKINARDPLDVWYYSFLRTRRSYKLNVDHSEAEDGKLSIFVNHRITNASGKLLGVTGVGMDMTKAAQMLAEAQEKYGRTVYLVDPDGLVQVHPDVSRINRYTIAREAGMAPLLDDILDQRSEPASFEFDRGDRHILLSSLYIPEFDWYLLVEQNETDALAAARGNLYRTLGIGATASLLILFLCVVTINHFQSRLEALIKTDPLTGALNRRGLDEAFAMAKHRCERFGTAFSAILLDMDDFKTVNDTQGHLEGDRILAESAATIRETIRPMDNLGRLGGDEFLLILEGDMATAQAVADRLQETFVSREAPVRFSCGITLYQDGDTLDTIMHRADMAMYEAKNGQCGGRVATL